MAVSRSGRKRRSPDQIIVHLREADTMLSSGQSVAQVCQKLGVCEQTYHRWRNQYGGMKADAVKRLKQLEEENRRLKRAVADLTLDKQILKEANEYLGNG
jgi:transposase-like protein